MLRTVAHNAALAACMLQLCVLYMGSALFKIQGEKWQEGTAVYYITRVAEYNAWPEISGLLALSPLAITAATYLTVFAQLSFPFTLLRAWSRHLVLFVLVGMHLGIGVLMGLPIFSALHDRRRYGSGHRRGVASTGPVGAPPERCRCALWHAHHGPALRLSPC